MSKYDYILLDWDGNLAQTLDIWLRSCREPLEKRGFHLTDHQIGASFGAFKTHMIEWGVEDPENVVVEADEVAKTLLPSVELYPDVLEVLEELKKRGKKLALVTTGLREIITEALEKYSLLELFDATVMHHDTENHKPHAEPLEKALELLGGTKDRAVMVGDSDKDLGAAINCGIDSILFHSPDHTKYHRLDDLRQHKPTHVIENFRDILDIVE